MRDGLQINEHIFASQPNAKRKPLDRESLPTPLQYLTARNLMPRSPRGDWAAIICPSHKGGEEKTPSLRISLVDGHFKCMACGVSGGDIVALHRIITGAGFIAAVRELGGRFRD